MYPIFRQTFAYILYTKLKELWQLNFVYKMYTKVCQNVGYILYTICIHELRSTKSAHHKNYVYNLYTKFIQNVYTNKGQCTTGPKATTVQSSKQLTS